MDEDMAGVAVNAHFCLLPVLRTGQPLFVDTIRSKNKKEETVIM